MVASRISSSCSPVTGAADWRVISPCVRNTGGSPTRRCRSDELDWTSAFSSSPSVRSAALYWGAAKSSGRPVGGAATGDGAAGPGVCPGAPRAGGRGGGGEGGGGGGRGGGGEGATGAGAAATAPP